MYHNSNPDSNLNAKPKYITQKLTLTTVFVFYMVNFSRRVGDLPILAVFDCMIFSVCADFLSTG